MYVQQIFTNNKKFLRSNDVEGTSRFQVVSLSGGVSANSECRRQTDLDF